MRSVGARCVVWVLGEWRGLGLGLGEERGFW